MVGVLTFASLFAGMAIDGAHRLSPDFSPISRRGGPSRQASFQRGSVPPW